ncbi:MAG: GH25 family lysozyme, partial [Clostridium sp.]|nr:GH25 family lysozyme [Clostridium sp.]
KGMYKGLYIIDGNKYHFGELSGHLKKGWSITLDKREYYSDENGIVQEGFKEIDGNTYYFTFEKGMYKNSQTIGEINYNFTESGILLDKWVTIDDNTYYYKDGKMLKGLYIINGNKYHFGELSGHLKKGWSITLDKREYYSDENGIVQEGFKEIDGETYYFTFEKGMYKGLYIINGNKYHFGELSGHLKKGWSITLDKREYYSDENGIVQEGFKDIDGETYYFTFEKGMYKGIYIIDGKRYHFGELSGHLKKGWSITLAKKNYYSTSDGVVVTGNQFIDGNWYTFANDGSLKDGWQTINDKKYYFYSDGSRAKYIAKIAGVRYEFSATGELEHENIKVIADISKHQGYIDWDALWSSGEIDGVILRVGYSLGMDSKFLYNLTEVNRLKIPYSIYHFSIAENAYEAQLEANNLINWYTDNNLKPFMDVFYDIETWKEGNNSSTYISIADYDAIISTYKSTLNNNGIGMSVYTNKNYAETRLSDYGRAQIGWIAHFATYCGYKGTYRGWQYTSKGSLPGISGNVDLSIFYW